MTSDPRLQAKPLKQWLWGTATAAVMSLYYLVFYFPPRLTGGNDPDRFYHIGLSQLISIEGFLRTLPQVEDLAWGKYFPDKEFLFHALTGGAYALGGPMGVLLVVPVLGVAIVLCIYFTLSRVWMPWRASAFTLLTVLLGAAFVFRITLLRPHLLAILFFCLLMAAILRGRAWLAAVAAAGFALSYHAFYIPLLVIMIAGAIRWPEDIEDKHCARWAAVGLACGILLNPYFPSTLVMSWSIIKIALGMGVPPGLRSGNELQPLGLLEYIDFFALLPLTLLGASALAYFKGLRLERKHAGFWFLFVLCGLLTLLSLKSARATEYAVPGAILLAGYSLAMAPRSWWFGAACLATIIVQGHSASTYYRDVWSKPQEGYSGWYLAAVSLLPPEADGKKVFNCEWVAGSYILFRRPKVRFVDLLEPALLWQAAPGKYLSRDRLTDGLSLDVYRDLRQGFAADYVICGSSALNQQMQRDAAHFEPIVGSAPMGPLKVFRVLLEK